MSEARKLPTLATLLRAAFPEHEYSLRDLRSAAYAQKTGDTLPADFKKHLEGCSHCQRQWALMWASDPLLTGESDERLKVVIRSVQNPSLARQLAERAGQALAHASAGVAHEGKATYAAATAFFGALRPGEPRTHQADTVANVGGEKCRVGVCGFDPMIVKGYIKTGERALWWHISDELYEEYKPKPGDTISGKLLAVYDGEGKKVESTNEPFEWKVSKESGLAVLLPPEAITEHKLTEFHFLELLVQKVGDRPVYPGQQKQSSKWWPEEKMKLDYKVSYIA